MRAAKIFANSYYSFIVLSRMSLPPLIPPSPPTHLWIEDISVCEQVGSSNVYDLLCAGR